jgi:hypothetical protein
MSMPGHQGVAATSPAPIPPGQDDGEERRRVAHELVGQAHAVLVVAHRNDQVLGFWSPAEVIEDVKGAAPPLWLAVGEMQAAIGSGDHDEFLTTAGLDGPSVRPKRRRLRQALERLAKVIGGTNSELSRKWLKNAAGLARTAIGSMAREIPGGEVVAEALDGVIAGLDMVETIAYGAETDR